MRTQSQTLSGGDYVRYYSPTTQFSSQNTDSLSNEPGQQQTQNDYSSYVTVGHSSKPIYSGALPSGLTYEVSIGNPLQSVYSTNRTVRNSYSANNANQQQSGGMTNDINTFNIEDLLNSGLSQDQIIQILSIQAQISTQKSSPPSLVPVSVGAQQNQYLSINSNGQQSYNVS